MSLVGCTTRKRPIIISIRIGATRQIRMTCGRTAKAATPCRTLAAGKVLSAVGLRPAGLGEFRKRYQSTSLFVQEQWHWTFPHDWLAGDVIVHSTDGFNGIGNGPANVLWTSPIAGLASITGSVWLGRDIGRSVDWSLLINGVAITGGSLSSGDPFNRASPFLFSAGSGGAAAINNLAVSPGNTLELLFPTCLLGPGDFVGVNLNLSVVASAVPGDYNGNGVVDAADYTVWRDTLGSTTDLARQRRQHRRSAGKIDQPTTTSGKRTSAITRQRVRGECRRARAGDSVDAPRRNPDDVLSPTTKGVVNSSTSETCHLRTLVTCAVCLKYSCL